MTSASRDHEYQRTRDKLLELALRVEVKGLTREAREIRDCQVQVARMLSTIRHQRKTAGNLWRDNMKLRGGEAA